MHVSTAICGAKNWGACRPLYANKHKWIKDVAEVLQERSILMKRSMATATMKDHLEDTANTKKTILRFYLHLDVACNADHRLIINKIRLMKTCVNCVYCRYFRTKPTRYQCIIQGIPKAHKRDGALRAKNRQNWAIQLTWRYFLHLHL